MNCATIFPIATILALPNTLTYTVKSLVFLTAATINFGCLIFAIQREERRTKNTVFLPYSLNFGYKLRAGTIATIPPTVAATNQEVLQITTLQ